MARTIHLNSRSSIILHIDNPSSIGYSRQIQLMVRSVAFGYQKFIGIR